MRKDALSRLYPVGKCPIVGDVLGAIQYIFEDLSQDVIDEKLVMRSMKCAGHTGAPWKLVVAGLVLCTLTMEYLPFAANDLIPPHIIRAKRRLTVPRHTYSINH